MWNYSHAQRFQPAAATSQGPQSTHELLLSLRGLPIALASAAAEPPVPGILEDVSARLLSMGVVKAVPDLSKGALVMVSVPSGAVIHRFSSPVISIAAAGTWVQVAMPRQVESVQRRQYTRVRVSAQLVFARDGGESGHGQTLDLSPGGLRFSTTTPLEAGHRLFLSFTTPDGASFRGIEAVVVRAHTNSERITVAVQFGVLEPQQENDLVTTLLRLQGRPAPGHPLR